MKLIVSMAAVAVMATAALSADQMAYGESQGTYGQNPYQGSTYGQQPSSQQAPYGQNRYQGSTYGQQPQQGQTNTNVPSQSQVPSSKPLAYRENPPAQYPQYSDSSEKRMYSQNPNEFWPQTEQYIDGQQQYIEGQQQYYDQPSYQYSPY